jgi:hypothetical protein
MEDSMHETYDADPKLSKPETVDGNESAGTMAKLGENKKPMILELLKRDWPHLSALQRGERLRFLAAQGFSKRGLAREIGCSPSLIRQLIGLAEISENEKQMLMSGKCGRKKTLERARNKRAEEEQRRLVEDQQARERLIEEYRRLITDFVEARVFPCDRGRFFSEMNFQLYVLRRAKFGQDCPTAQAGVRAPEDPWEILNRYKPKGEPVYVPEKLSFDVEWLLGCLPGVIRSREIALEALTRAERRLLYGTG